LKYIILIIALMFSSQVHALDNGWTAKRIGIYVSLGGAPKVPSIREWDRVLSDYDYAIASPDHTDVYSLFNDKILEARSENPSGSLNRELIVWQHPNLPDKMLCRVTQHDKTWVVKEDNAWKMIQKSEYKKYKIKSEWENLCFHMNAKECEESLVWSIAYVKRTVYKDEWVWRNAFMGDLTNGGSQNDLNRLNMLIPPTARNVFYAGEWVYFQKKESVAREIMMEE